MPAERRNDMMEDDIYYRDRGRDRGFDRDREYDRDRDYWHPWDAAPAVPPNRGDNDGTDDPINAFRVLLVQDMNKSTTPELLAKGMEKLYAGASDGTVDSEAGAKPGSLLSTAVIRDRETRQSMCYGFAEFDTHGQAADALAKYQDLEQSGKVLTIGSRVVRMRHAHKGVFMPPGLPGQLPCPARFQFRFCGQIVKYCDDRYYAATWFRDDSAPRHPSQTDETKPVAQEDLGVKADSVAGKKPLNKTDPVSEQKALAKTEPVQAVGDHLVGVEISSWAEKKKAAPTLPGHLQHWQNKAAELREGQAPTEVKQSYAIDTTDLKACYLCGSKFETSQGVLRHVRESQLHKSNLENEAIVKRAEQRLKDKKIDPTQTLKIPKPAKAAPQPREPTKLEYVDRAKMRRQEEAQSGSSNPGPVSFSLKRPRDDNEPAPAPAKPSYGKGRGMLEKVGWSEGQGLGAGSGITAPIDQNLYAAGVGLGHEGSKKGDAMEEAQRVTQNDRGSFVEQTRERARNRFRDMQGGE